MAKYMSIKLNSSEVTLDQLLLSSVNVILKYQPFKEFMCA